MELLPLLLGLLLATPLTTGIQEIRLDMAKNSFDDQYQGCQEKMTKALPKLNRTEFANNKLFAKYWTKARREQPKDTWLQLEQAIALRTYTWDTSGLYREFNAAVRQGGRSRQEYLEKFQFKVLHFLITEALGVLRGDSPQSCLTVYRGVQDKRFTAKPGQIVRFGQFASSSTNRTKAQDFGTATFFEVETCQGAEIREFSHFPDESEVLIPPFETFKVTKVTQKGEKTLIRLKSHGVHSNYNCAYTSGKSIPRNTPHGRRITWKASTLKEATSTP